MKPKYSPYRRFGKRLFDLTLAVPGSVVMAPVLGIIALMARLTLGHPILFRQMRPGLYGRPFVIYKFRTMTDERDLDGIVLSDAERLTRLGAFLRKTSLDELPELFNVLKGDMSLVGPRPEVAEYVKVFAEEYMKILRARPGLSDYASIKYRDEETILSAQKNPQVYYREMILPDKLNLAQQYTSKISFKTDLKIILATIQAILNPNVI